MIKPTPQFRGSGLHTSIQKPLRLICLYTKIVATINVTIPNNFTYIELNFNISILKAVPIIGIKKSIAISISKIPNIICWLLGNISLRYKMICTNAAAATSARFLFKPLRTNCLLITVVAFS